MPARVASGYTAPMGLLGLMTTIARVLGGDLGVDVLEPGQPIVYRVAENHGGGPNGKVRGRDQNLVTVFNQGLESHGNQLTDPIAINTSST